MIPSIADVVLRMERLIRGDLSRADVADWASEFIIYDDPQIYPEVSDMRVWRALKQLSGADLPNTDRDYLHDEEDFTTWLAELRDAS